MRTPQLPLTALRAFEATARHVSFTKAAEELNVTAGAVARQVHGLEDRLGVQLVRRNGPQLSITEVGLAALPSLGRGFQELSNATTQITQAHKNPSLTLCADTSFAALWLTPNLSAFRQIYPECEVRIVSQQSMAGKFPDYIDAVVSYAPLEHADFHECAKYAEEIRPYVSTGYLDQHPKQQLELLMEHPLICVEHTPTDVSYPDWAEWFSQNGIKGQPIGPQVKVELVILGLHACLSGQGYALISNLLADDSVKRGEIRPVFAQELSIRLTRYVFARSQCDNPYVERFLLWLQSKLT